MYNPFAEKISDQEDDARLIETILSGSRNDLETLILRHQAWIYNIALKMVLDPQDAQDVTQEILIKMVTKLSTFNGRKGSFRTWLYRIVANHVINMKKKKYEKVFASAEEAHRVIDTMPDQGLDGIADASILIEELKIKCWTSMLLCLDRKHRLVFILGEVFDVGDRIGSEVLEISKENFRKMLSRARARIDHFMNHNCGLIHPDNSCHCSRKLKGFIENGFIKTDRIEFYQQEVDRIKAVVVKNMGEFDRICSMGTRRMFKEQPFYDPPFFKDWIKDTFSSHSLEGVFFND
jgi:RNA polymerase sigma factor (sigma-70 family)